MATDHTLSQNIRTQVEYYFGDTNYPTDKFLKKLAKHDGFVPLSAVAKFSKIQALTQDFQVLVEAIRLSEKLVLSHDSTRVKRKDPLPEKVRGPKPTGKVLKKYKGGSLQGQTSVRLDGNLDPEFVDSLLSQVAIISNLDIRKNDIGANGGLLLADQLMKSECQLSFIFLFRCHLGDTGIKHLCNALETNRSLVKLNLCENGFSSAAGSHLASAITKNTTLKTLDLNNNQFGNEAASLISNAFLVNKTITTFSLWNTGIGDEIAHLWLKILETNITVEKLNLNGNSITSSLLDDIHNKLKR